MKKRNVLYKSHAKRIEKLNCKCADLIIRTEAAMRRKAEAQERIDQLKKKGNFWMKDPKTMSLEELEKSEGLLLKVKERWENRVKELSTEIPSENVAGPSGRP